MRKRSFVFTCLCLMLCEITAAQSYQYIYYLDNNLASTDKGNAFFIAKGTPENGLLRVDYFYKHNDRMLMSIHFTDSTLSNMTGLFRSYYENGKVENEGMYKNSVEDASWVKWDSSGFKTDSSVFLNGKKNIKAFYTYDKAGGLSSYKISDSINEKEKYIFFKNKNIQYEVDYLRDSGLMKIYENGAVRSVPVAKKDLVEASFTGGETGFRKYLQNNLNANVPADNGSGNGTYRVIVRFIINIDGSVSDAVAETNFGHGMEAEVIRIIEHSPAWIPTKISGYAVPAYRRQPITFYVDDGTDKEKSGD